METTNVLDAILAVFESVGQWLTGAINSIVPMFYNEGSLTFVGVLSVAGLAISIGFLLVNTIKSFLRFS